MWLCNTSLQFSARGAYRVQAHRLLQHCVPHSNRIRVFNFRSRFLPSSESVIDNVDFCFPSEITARKLFRIFATFLHRFDKKTNILSPPLQESHCVVSGRSWCCCREDTALCFRPKLCLNFRKLSLPKNLKFASLSFVI